MKYTLKELKINEIEIEKSKFIAYLFPIKSLDEFNEFLTKLRKENPKARHFCYAYTFQNNKRGNDDGEPKGTAGIPLLNALEKNNLQDAAVIVIRYFGGTLLGAGRLLRTYVQAFEEVFNVSTLIELDDKLEVKVELSYELFDIMKNYLKVNNFNILNTEFNDKISIVFIAPLSFNKESFNEYFLSRVKITEINDYIDKIEVGK